MKDNSEINYEFESVNEIVTYKGYKREESDHVKKKWQL